MPGPDSPSSGRVRPFGDTALVVEAASVAEAHGLAAAATGLDAGIEDVVVGYRSITVIADPTRADVGSLGERLAALRPPVRPAETRRVVEIPVAFDGPDLEEVAASVGLAPADVTGLLTRHELGVAFLGFLPGFAYLDGLPSPLAGLDRRDTPRTSVPAGSLGLAGGFAAVYPRRSPGGWHLIGRTGFVLFDPEAPPYATLRPGDDVRFVAVDDPGELPDPEGAARPGRAPLQTTAARAITVGDPGLSSTVQDLGRRGVAALGVPRAGAADPYALRAANRLVGNDEGVAGVEMTARGASLRFGADAHVAVVGRAEVSVDDRPVPCDSVVPVSAGQVLAVREILGDLRCYLAVAGAVEGPAVMGSRASDTLSGLGPGPLRRGDRVGLGPPGRPRGRLAPGTMLRAAPAGAGPVERVVRVVTGPDGPDQVMAGMTSAVWEVSPDSDRVGVRLTGDRPLAPPPERVASRGMVTGAVQVPLGGWPVVLSCDHATVGGYPVAACVISADIGVVGQCRPGDKVRFEQVDLDEAHRARAAIERAVGSAVVGWYPVDIA